MFNYCRCRSRCHLTSHYILSFNYWQWPICNQLAGLFIPTRSLLITSINSSKPCCFWVNTASVFTCFWLESLFLRKTAFYLYLRPKESIFEPPHDKTNSVTVHPAKTQISLMPRLIWVFAGVTVILLVLSWGSSFGVSNDLLYISVEECWWGGGGSGIIHIFFLSKNCVLFLELTPAVKLVPYSHVPELNKL